jgi:hypothetical protein
LELPEAIARFKNDLAKVKSDGASQVEIDKLELYLDQLLVDATTSLEQRRMQHQSDLAQYSGTLAIQVENFKAMISAGKEAINSSIIINGGAVIALMSFMGNAVGKSGARYIPLLSSRLLFFGTGVFCGGLSFGLRYVAQFLYSKPSRKKLIMFGHCVNGLVWIATSSALLCFVLGVLVSYHNLVYS